MNKLDFELLDKLTQTPGLPGRESQVARLIQTHLPSGCNASQDDLGNLVAHLPGDGTKVMLVAHMDEVGLIVRRITPDGFLLVERLGGISVRALPGARLDLWTENGQIPAHAGLLPGHLDNKQFLPLQEIYIDIDASSSEEAHRWGARVGDGLTWSSALGHKGEHALVSKALDDRLGCLILITLAHALHTKQLNFDLYLAFVVQEETGFLGGVPVVNTIAPDIVIGVDGTLAFDTPDLERQQSDIQLGAGPTIKIMDAIRGKIGSYLPHQDTAELIRKLADDNNIPLQVEIATGLSTAVTPLPFVGQGIRTAALSIPIRYHHTPVETADLRDVAWLVELLTEYLRSS
ncbi:MAG: M20/M25/M40 family metallo-hydrolase [Chloroflexota bacterium]|nr:M20/M25/M40 family metallo-hydrolase [Chloroflexota bacterium]